MGVLGHEPGGWALSAQWAAALPLVLATLPFYAFLRRLTPGPAALAGAVFFCVLPAIARLGADGVGDSLGLFFLCLALSALARGWQMSDSSDKGAEPALRQGVRALWLLASGAATGLALLTDKEVLVFAAVVPLALIGFQLLPTWRQSWVRVAMGGAGFAAGLIVAVSPYLIVSGNWRPQAAVARLLGDGADGDRHTATMAEVDTRPWLWRTEAGARMSFVKKDPGRSARFNGLAAATKEFAHELATVFQYWIGALALLGLWANRRLKRPIEGVAQLFFVCYALLALWFASASGYLSERHLAPLALVGLGAAGQGAIELGRRISQRLQRKAAAPPQPPASSLKLGWAVVALAAVACLPKTLAPLHAARLGHRQAGQWLAVSQAAGAVLDTRGWTGLFSGRRTYNFHRAKQAFADPQLAYVVVERHELTHNSLRAETLRNLLGDAAQRVAAFSPPGSSAEKAVDVYRWSHQRFALRFGREQHRE